MNKPWLKHYPSGVPEDIDPEAYSSLVALLEESFQRYRDQEAYVCMGRAMTYGELDDMSRALAAWLQKEGLQRGDRVAVMLPNILQFPVVMAAVLRAGCILVNVNPLYTARELAHQLEDSGALAVIVLENFAHTLEQALPYASMEKIVVATMGDLLGIKGPLVNFAVRKLKKLVAPYSLPDHVSFKAALRAGRALKFSPPEIKSDDIAVLQYTGGTTGVSKGAMLLHRTLVSALLASEAWMQPGIARKTINGQRNFVCVLPLYHVFAFVNCSLLAMRAGARNILIPNPRDLRATINALRPYKLHIFPAVNTLFQALLHEPRLRTLDFSEMVISLAGGMAVQQRVAQEWLDVTGTPIVEGYGLSETSAGIACTPTDSLEFTGTIGLPMPGVSVRIVDEAGEEVPIGERGEIAIKGPQVMAGYWKRDDETARAMTADGWFLSGDIGIMDEGGWIRIVDRKKDMILVSGFNVYPNEVEDVAAMHPDVKEVAAIGVPDEQRGEMVKLFVVKANERLTEAELLKFCADRLTGYKRPRSVEFREALPKSNIGKILRRELRPKI